MAAVATSGTPSLASVLPPQSQQLAGLLAGEALTAGAPCYIKGSDGRVYLSNGTAANAAAKVRGWAAEACATGEAVTLFFDVNFRYGAGMTPGTDLFIGATGGVLSDTATTGGTAPVGFVVDAARIHVWQSKY
jgi:hypothetical protein